MKTIIFDTGPIITFAMNNMLETFKLLKSASGGEFYITEAIKNEVIEKPLASKRYKFEALQVLKEFQDGVFKVYAGNIKEKAEKILSLANSTFKAKGNYIQIVHYAETEVLAAAIDSGADAIVIDERTTRVLVENPSFVKDRLEKKLHTNVEVNKENLEEIKKMLQKIVVLRSFELATVAYEKGILDEYLLHIKDPKKELLEGVLWGVKLAGCSVSEDEIDQVLKLEKIS